MFVVNLRLHDEAGREEADLFVDAGDDRFDSHMAPFPPVSGRVEPGRDDAGQRARVFPSGRVLAYLDEFVGGDAVGLEGLLAGVGSDAYLVGRAIAFVEDELRLRWMFCMARWRCVLAYALVGLRRDCALAPGTGDVWVGYGAALNVVGVRGAWLKRGERDLGVQDWN